MWLTRLGAEGFRNLAPFDVEFSAGLNIVHGDNGAGKTSLLESIFFLSHARSFRTSRVDRLPKRGIDALHVYGSVESPSGLRTNLGISRCGRDTALRVGGRSASKVSLLARHLPVMAIGSESHRLLEDGPELRRRFLDWGVFHMEHPHLTSWRDYSVALNQRNAALRVGSEPRSVSIWNEALIEHGERITAARRSTLNAVIPHFQRLAETLLPEFKFQLEYRPGWPASSTTFREHLEQSTSNDIKRGFTQYGPHRAEIAIRNGDREARQTLSRGQQKLIVSALLLAQTRGVQFMGGSQPIVLFDDLPAELDRAKRTTLLSVLVADHGQVFVTAIEPADLPTLVVQDTRMFHVEQGNITQVI